MKCPYLNDVNCFNSAIKDIIKYIDKLKADSYDAGYTAGLHDAMQDYKDGSENE